jgi:hypothetical protein
MTSPAATSSGKRQSEEFFALARWHPDTEFQTTSGVQIHIRQDRNKTLKFKVISWREYTARSTPVTILTLPSVAEGLHLPLTGLNRMQVN